jgi:hypothetical protein
MVAFILMKTFRSFIFLQSRDLPEGDEDVPRDTT